MEKLRIRLRSEGHAYAALVNNFKMGLFLGSSPDEALGYVIRELWLSNAFENPVQLIIDFDKETEAAATIHADDEREPTT